MRDQRARRDIDIEVEICGGLTRDGAVYDRVWWKGLLRVAI